MPVNPSSVISTTINTFDSVFYTAITDLEDYVYTSGTNGGLTETQPTFQKLSDSIVTWMNIDREDNVRDLVVGLYGYKMMVDLYAVSDSLIASSDSRIVFDIDGYRSRIKTDVNTYYNDYPTITFDSGTSKISRNVGSWITDGFSDTMSITVSGSASNDNVYTISGAPTALDLVVSGLTTEGPSGFIKITGTGTVILSGTNLTSDIALIDGAKVNQEDVDIPVLITGYQTKVGGKTHDILFDSAGPSGTALTKLQMAQYIFNTHNYKEIYDGLNVGSLTVPALV